MTIVGDFNMAEAKKLVHDYFNDIPSGAPVVQPTIVEPKKTAEVRDTAYDNIQMPALIMAYHIPGITSNDMYAVNMLNTLLAQGQSSRLYSTIVNDKQMAMELAAMPLPLEQPGLSIVLALPNMNVELSQLENEIDKEIDKLQKEPISDKEFQKLQNQIENQLVSSNATIEDRAYNLAQAYTYFKNTNEINEELAKFRSITKEDLQKAAQKYFTKDNRLVLYYLPKK